MTNERHWLRLIAAWTGIAVVALSIHVLMLQVLHVPYPNYAGVGMLGLAEPFGHVLALLLLYQLAKPSLGGSFLRRVVLLALLDATVTEVFRLNLMMGVTTASAAFPAILTVVGLCEHLILALLIVTAAPTLTNAFTKVIGAAAIAACMVFLVSGYIQQIEGHFASLARPEIYSEPYGPVVLTISYAAFIGTVAGSYAFIALIGPRLSKKPAINLLLATALLLLLRGTLIAQVVFPWKMKAGILSGALSASQFFFEDLVMVVLAWLVWHWSQRHQPAAS